MNRWPEPARQPCRAPALQMRAWKEPAFGTPRVVHGGLQGWLRRWGRACCRQGRAAQGGGGASGRTMRRQWRRAAQGRRGDGGEASALGGDGGEVSPAVRPWGAHRDPPGWRPAATGMQQGWEGGGDLDRRRRRRAEPTRSANDTPPVGSPAGGGVDWTAGSERWRQGSRSGEPRRVRRPREATGGRGGKVILS